MSVETEARKALTRLRRAIEKAEHELAAVEGALRTAEGRDFPAEAFAETEARFREIQVFVEEQSERLEEKMLHAGGLEPGRVRRTS